MGREHGRHDRAEERQGVCSIAIRPRASTPERMRMLTTIGAATRIAAAATSGFSNPAIATVRTTRRSSR